MPKTITLTNSNVSGMAVDLNLNRIVVSYSYTDDENMINQSVTKFFYADLPKETGDGTENPTPVGEERIQLPPKAREAFEHLMKYIKDRGESDLK